MASEVSDKNLSIYLFVPNILFSDNCYIKNIQNGVTRAKISFNKSFVNSLSFLCDLMLLICLEELVFGPFEPFLIFFSIALFRQGFFMLVGAWPGLKSGGISEKLPPPYTYFLIDFKEISSTILAKVRGGNCPPTSRGHTTGC